ncbi:ImmA/IrrE family metallo-endopeptidase [Stenotrophomonas muris]|uniref:ImmA/IrrE family metallo-endopeptidase n=1 Tax=Stenotrophomonas muris TaxID=2963283 RepID=UPI00114ED54F|nr:uncharacterized protein DUF955 [Stenotrophomonas maltophilia]
MMAVVKKRPSVVVDHAADMANIQQVRALLDGAGLGDAPVDVSGAASLLGLQIVYEQMADEMSGYLENRNGQWVVGVNAYHAGVRQRFTIAHEIAHYVLHRKQQGTFRDVIFMRRSSNANSMEREADTFAAQLLMPEDQLIRDIRSGMVNVMMLAARYNVSALAMKYRLQNLGYAVS